MNSKRVKISFESVNGDNYTVIDKSVIDAANTRIKEAMKVVVRDFEKKEKISQQQAAMLVLNA